MCWNLWLVAFALHLYHACWGCSHVFSCSLTGSFCNASHGAPHRRFSISPQQLTRVHEVAPRVDLPNVPMHREEAQEEEDTKKAGLAPQVQVHQDLIGFRGAMQYAPVGAMAEKSWKETQEWFCCSDGQVAVVGSISEEKDEPPTIEETENSKRLGQLKEREKIHAQDMVLACPCCTCHKEKYWNKLTEFKHVSILMLLQVDDAVTVKVIRVSLDLDAQGATQIAA